MNSKLASAIALLGFVLVTALVEFQARAQTNASGQSAAEKLGWQLAVHSYTFQKFSIFEAIDKTAALGIKHMSISGGVSLGGSNKVTTVNLSSADVAAIDKKIKAAGFDKFVNIGVVQLSADEAKSRKVFEFAKNWGITTLVAEPPSDALDTVEKLCKEYNIKVAIHNHPQGHSVYWDPSFLAETLKGRSPLLGACADTGHWMTSGLEPLECLKKLDGRVLALHFKDRNKVGPGGHDVPWGTGVGQMKEMMVELKRQNFHGAFCVEYEYHWENSSPEIAECAKFWNATCVELAPTN